MKQKLLTIGLLIIAFFLSMRILGTNSNLTERVSVKKILEIKVGMTQNEVLGIIGKPFEIEQSYQNKTTFVYSKPVKYSRNYPMLWVHFDKNNKVYGVLAKRYIYFGLDDEGIYHVSTGNKPSIVDESIFNECFD